MTVPANDREAFGILKALHRLWWDRNHWQSPTPAWREYVLARLRGESIAEAWSQCWERRQTGWFVGLTEKREEQAK